MPRRPRNYLQDHTYHLVQRGVNKTKTFFNPEDFRVYLALWERYASKYRLNVHAYCLMSNHVHFLVTPKETISLSATTRDVGANYAAYFNTRYNRTGTLWEGRHRSSLVDSERYLLRCYRYIELNPVRAHLVGEPESYPWSSYRRNVSGEYDWLTPHPVFCNLSSKVRKRSQHYRDLFDEALTMDQEQEITAAVLGNRPLATESFLEDLEERHQFALTVKPAGRPKKG